MADPYEVDDEGNALSGSKPAAEADPAEQAAIRRQVESTLRVMTLSMVIGLVVLVVLAVAVSSLRGAFILAAIVYLFGSLGAQWYLRRRFLGPLKG